ncbi:hypothetical protein [Clostridium manihotivorum]|uniref:Uncharacterized protein n=1 Tax=Clostridium manihotivorum TaxID=2320868 RepID=A0A3R5VB78_9CLOT|nr:hypothetical protein [Clostridium manihotivorum]QAA34381.1 hypothetical protein C1I91_23580 [Clostridium manihotivorum]
MNKDIRMNYISLAMTVFFTFIMGLIYFLLRRSMIFPLKVGYTVLALVSFILIVFNIIMIMRKSTIKY